MISLLRYLPIEFPSITYFISHLVHLCRLLRHIPRIRHPPLDPPVSPSSLPLSASHHRLHLAPPSTRKLERYIGKTQTAITTAGILSFVMIEIEHRIVVSNIQIEQLLINAYEVCLTKDLLREQDFVFGRMRNAKPALAIE
ncbi:unnamed protein product [Lactuca saligna]|uniref:Uncharacterized protein n=1 Tax=Lactuca saligna TaxID=75948 RepID=A0AA35YLX0_LACSI|nr:unnamed protein product [Lactuca saligna]